MKALMNNKLPDPQLNQRARASIDFLIHLFGGTQALREHTRQVLADEFADDDLPDDLDARDAVLVDCAERLPAFRAQQVVGEWHAREHGVLAIEAFDAERDSLVPALDALDTGGSSLTCDEDFIPPDYWAGVEYHRTTGGWDGHPYMGYVHSEIVHRRMVAALFPGPILQQRRDVAALAPKARYDRILDVGCSTGLFTLALAETYPDARISGVDLSVKTLEHARRVANARGYSWDLYQMAGEDTTFDDGSFDLVASFILLHEIPPDAIRRLFREAFRLLTPGGDLLMSDVARFADLSKLDGWYADRGARFGGEPHWRASASLDLAAELAAAGFSDVQARALNPGGYPYVIQGRKPE